MNSNIIIIALLIFFTTSLHASSEKKPKKEEHVKTPDEVQEEGRKSMAITNSYVHQWIKFPTISAKSIFTNEVVEIIPQKGEAIALVFIASWCLPCQEFAPRLQKLAKHYNQINGKFLFAFTHDTIDDAKGFAKEYGFQENSILTSQQMLKDFHNPKLPAIYIADRRGWFLQRLEGFDAKGIDTINDRLAKLTSH